MGKKKRRSGNSVPRPRINIENAVAMFAEYDSADEERRAAILLDGFTQTAPTTESRGRLVNGVKALYQRSAVKPPDSSVGI